MTSVTVANKMILVAAAVLALVVFPSCYTIFSHPRLASMNYQKPSDDQCVRCHTSDDLWKFVHPTRLPRQNPKWELYYRVPWWFDHRHLLSQYPAAADTLRGAEDD